MKIEIRQGKYPGEWRMQPMIDAWPDASRAVYEGTEQEAGAIFGAVLTWINPAASRAADVLAALNDAVTKIQDRLDADRPLMLELPEDATYADVKVALGDILSLSAWFLASAFASCEQGNVSRAVRAFGRAAYWHGTFQAHVARIQCDLESPPPGPAAAISLSIKAADLSAERQAMKEFAAKGGKARALKFGRASEKDAIRAAWASGKYSSRALCAEQEAAALGISFDTARKALRNTPDPA